MSDGQSMIEGFKISPVQKASWLQVKKVEGMPAHAELTLQVKGQTTPVALKNALTQLVNTWEIFRTGFPCPTGVTLPLQVIGEAQFAWEEHTITTDIAQACLPPISPCTYDYAGGPLIHVSCTVLNDCYILQLRFASLLVDRGTLKMIPTALASLLAGEALEEPARYVSVAHWLDELLTSEDSAEGIAYWSRIDHGQRLDLDLRLPASQDATLISCRTDALPLPSLQDIEALAERLESSSDTVCFAAWAALMYRLTGERKLVLNRHFDGRADEDLAEVPGPLDRFLPIEVNLMGSLTFETFLGTVEDLTEDAFEWQECFQNKDSRFTSFAFVFDSAPESASANGVTLTPLDLQVNDTAFDLMLVITQKDDALDAAIRFNRSVYDADFAGLILERFRTLLAASIRQPDLAIAHHDLVGDVEKTALRAATVGEEKEYPNKHFTQLFRECVARNPAHNALEFAGKRLTYRELDVCSDQLASRLRDLGAGPEKFVAISGVRSLELVIGSIAIFKSGAIYQPLDPEYPKALLEYELELTRPIAYLAFEEEVSELPKHQAEIVLLDGVAASEEEVRLEPVSVGENQAAYIIFTSGSSGKPKGVVVSHQSFANQCLAIIDHHQMTEKDRFLEFASLNFDASIEQIFPALLCGATTVLREADGWEDTNVDTKIDALSLTIVNFPTAYWHLLARDWASRPCVLPNGKLRLVIAGGEKMLEEHVALWQSSPLQSIGLVNAYGPTEATISATMYDIPTNYNDQVRLPGLPIGAPLVNRRIHVLADDFSQARIGETGRLMIGGAGLARGYLDAPAQTASAFVPDPFSQQPGARLYDSGDRARLLPDHQFQFLGRKDHQVKIRGYRIELGEIETVLAEHWAIQEALVITRQMGDTPETVRLIAYFLPVEGAQIGHEEPREFLATRLPGYMVPSAFVQVDAWPMLPGGKVDRGALPDPEAASDKKHLAPKTPTQKILAQMWCSILGMNQVGIDDNFFDLGGHSLLTTQLVSRIRSVFQVEQDLIDYFTVTDLAGQAEMIDKALREGKGLLIPSLEKADRTRPLVISFAQQRLWLFQQINPESVAYNQPMALEITGPLQAETLEKVFGAILARHEVLRTTFAMDDKTPVQVIQPIAEWKLPRVDLSHMDAEPREAEMLKLAEEDARTPFDLEQGPLMRVKLIQLEDERFTLLFNTHHIVSDGWSQDVLIRELVSLYRAFSEGLPNPLPELPAQYADYAVWQRNWLSGEMLENQLDYWRGHLEGMPLSQHLPGSSAHGGGNRTGHHLFTFSEELNQALRNTCSEHHVTLFMLLMSAFNALVTTFTGDEDVVVGTDVANRNQIETENLLGFFVNQLVLRTDLKGDPRFDELLERVRQISLNAYAHQDLSFDKLVESINPDRFGDQNPLFRMKLVVQNAPSSTWELPSLGLKALPVGSGSAKFDLLFNIIEDDDVVRGYVEYNTEHYTEAEMERLFAVYEAILTQITGNIELRLSELKPLLEEVDKAREEKARNDLKAAGLNKFKLLKRGGGRA